MSCDVGEAKEGLENESHSPTLLSLHIRRPLVVPWLSYSPLDRRIEGSNPAEVDGFFQSVKIRSRL